MQTQLFIDQKDLSAQKVMIGLSGGINSMAVLVWLSLYPDHLKPKELHLFYAHFEEHSPDTEAFVLAGVEYAKKHFDAIHYKQTNNSIIELFRKSKMIPHPMVAPCTRLLKIEPMLAYMVEHKILVDLVGYVRTEKRRVFNMAKKSGGEVIDNSVQIGAVEKHFPISDRSNEWCFEIVKKHLGWYPKIYDIKDRKGKRVFTHNNCLPCKNMNKKDFEKVRKHYPEYAQRADELAAELGQYWGRNKGDASCQVCNFD